MSVVSRLVVIFGYLSDISYFVIIKTDPSLMSQNDRLKIMASPGYVARHWLTLSCIYWETLLQFEVLGLETKLQRRCP